MIIRDSQQEQGRQAMPAGLRHAVCAAVVDLGLQQSLYQGREQVRRQVALVFELAQRRRFGRLGELPIVVGKVYTASLHRQATLRGDLESWRGQPFSREELVGFDLSRLVGVNCTLELAERTSGQGRPYLVIETIYRPPRGADHLVPQGRHIPRWIEGLAEAQLPERHTGQREIPFRPGRVA